MKQQIAGKTVRVLGRTAEDGGMLWLMSSLSEAGFTVSGAAEVKLVLKADDTVSDPARLDLRPRYAVHVDGKRILDTRMEQDEETLTVLADAAKGTHTVRLVKLSECTQSLMALKEIITDGTVEPLNDAGSRIEFIGDSITCGYGVEENDPEKGFTTATENAEKSYAAIVSDRLGMDRVLASFSGHGIVSGYTGDPAVRNGSELVPPYYEKAGRNGYKLPSGREAEEIPWDFSRFRPDVIVINLGTNDLSWCAGRPERCAEYRKGYAEFLKTVRKDNPGAEILCILGVMGEGLNDSMEAAVSDYRAETGDEKIRSLALREQDGKRNGYGANYHPSEQTQRELADIVTEAVRPLCPGIQK